MIQKVNFRKTHEDAQRNQKKSKSFIYHLVTVLAVQDTVLKIIETNWLAYYKLYTNIKNWSRKNVVM